jgi:putative FmdB family regulatory protein
MPIYGYRCEQCGHELEAFQNMSDAPLRTCPECMGPLRKMLYPVGVVFKGSGFYSTDYNKGGAKASSNGGSESKSDSKSESKSESKPDSGSGSKSDSGSGSKADSGPKKSADKTD